MLNSFLGSLYMFTSSLPPFQSYVYETTFLCVISCVRYILAQEHGDVINLHDWFQSFKTVIMCPTTKGKRKLKQSPQPKRKKEANESENKSDASIQYPYLFSSVFLVSSFWVSWFVSIDIQGKRCEYLCTISVIIHWYYFPNWMSPFTECPWHSSFQSTILQCSYRIADYRPYSDAQ